MPLVHFFIFAFLSFVYGFLLTLLVTSQFDERVALSLPLSFATFSFAFLPSLFFDFPLFPWLTCITLAILLIVILISYNNKKINSLLLLKRYSQMNKLGILIYLFIFIHLLIQQILIPFYGLGAIPGDWFGHYRLTREFLTHEINAFPLRLPLYQFLQGFYLSIIGRKSFGEDFYSFQLIQVLVSFSFFPIVNLFAKELFQNKRHWSIVLLTSLLPYILIQALIPWPKMLASIYVLLAFYFYIKSRRFPDEPRNFWLTGLFGGLAILSHWLGLVYFMSIVIDFIWQARRRGLAKKFIWQKILQWAGLILVLLLPVYLWGLVKFGWRATILANLSILQKSGYDLFDYLLARIINFFSTFFFPLSLFIGFVRELPRLGIHWLGLVDLSSRWISQYLGFLPGNFTISLMTFWGFHLWKNKFVKKQINRLMQKMEALWPGAIIFTLASILIMILVQPGPITSGVALTGLIPSVVLGFLIFAHNLSKQSSWMFYVFFESLAMLFFWQILLHILSQKFQIAEQFKDPALLQIKEVLSYKQDFNLIFLHDIFKPMIHFVLGCAVLVQVSFLILIKNFCKPI
ncbi:MAG: hypothetical protein D6813_02650 [Calditrichaeota bacterium]|nr:MAG: hypothetical protein D6813_02650 [Calditrichota bacterium]